MRRRWIIRGLALALLTLCVTAWVGSYWRWALVRVPVNVVDVWIWNASGSSIIASDRSAKSQGWLCMVIPTEDRAKNSFEVTYQFAYFHVMGFAFDSQWVLFVPLWFPTLLSASLLALLWRKTRPHDTAKGFPVEPAAKPIIP